MKEQVRILHVIGVRPIGGVETVLLNYQLYMKEEKIQMDYLIFSDNKDGEFDRKVKAMGSQVFLFPQLKEIRFFSIAALLNKFFKKHYFDIVHVHSPNIASLCFYFAKKYGINIRILHSHSTIYSAKRWNRIRNRVLCLPLRWQATDLMACSEAAGNFLFYGYKKEYQVLNNAIDYKKYKYQRKKREDIRRKLGIEEGTLVVGTVGRMEKEKNYIFLIQIFEEIIKKIKKACLLFVGCGELEGQLKIEVKKRKMEKQVIFYGYSKNVEELLQAMDVFVMTSWKEGLPLVALEAQASGLPCLLSDAITKEVSVRNCSYMSLSSKIENWANKIIEIANQPVGSREEIGEEFIEKGFDIEKEAEKLKNYYINRKRRERNKK